MRQQVFADTSFWIALLDKADQHHGEAVNAFRKLSASRIDLFTSEFVVFETATYLNCSLKNHAIASAFMLSLSPSSVSVIPVEGAMIEKARRIFLKYDDIPLSFVDCYSFALMTELHMRLFAGFDKHFTRVGFVHYG